RRDPDRRMRLLDRAWGDVNVVQLMESAVMSHAVLGPKPLDQRDALIEQVPAVIHIHVKGVELFGNERAPEAHIESASAYVVEHRQLGCELDRVVERRNSRP